METCFVQVGGVRIGEGLFAFNATWPLAKLEICDENLTLNCFLKKWIFPKGSIRRLSKHEGLFSSGLCIEHDIANYTSFIVFWSMSFEKLKPELENRGYVVS